MMRKKSLSWIDATAVIAATTVGAGILALPIALSAFGTYGSALFLAVMGVLSLAAALMVAEALMRTDGGVHFPALVGRYLGRWGGALTFAGLAIYVYGSLTAYLIAGGALANALSGGAVPNWLGSVAYFAALTGIVYAGTKAVRGSEDASTVIVIVLAAAVIALALPFSGTVNATAAVADVPPAFGVVLFAYFAHEVIPSVRRRMGGDWRGLLKALALGTLIPAVLYVAWTVVIIGAVPHPLLVEAGANGQPATVPLGIVAGGLVALIGGVFAVFSMGSSYVGACFALADMFADLLASMKVRAGRWAAVALSVLPALALALLRPHSFVEMLELAGIYGGGLAIGIIVPLAYLAARRHGARKPEFSLPSPLAEVCAAALLGVTLAMLVYETWTLLPRF